jgi:type IV pilus assembly protein PilY1
MSMTARIWTKAACLAYGAAAMLAVTPSHATIDLANSPLFLTVTVPPNITVTLDDSGSMARAYVPEICDGASSNTCTRLNNRYAKSSHYNLLYYNPAITYPAPKNADGTERTTSFTAAYVNGFDTSAGTIDLSRQYRPTAYLDFPNGGSMAHGYMNHHSDDFSNTTRGTGAYYYVYNATNVGCTGTTAQRAVNNRCYTLVQVSSTSGPGGTDERQNFANWYSFARTRHLATLTAASLAFANLEPDVRVAWQALNSCRGSTTSLIDTDCDGYRNNFSGISNALAPFTGTHRSNFYRWLFQLPTDSTTPLPQAMRRVGQYYSTQTGANSPYNNITGNANSGQLSCRRNYHVMMTDGIWNTAYDIGGNRDGASNVLLGDQVTRYNARAPYSDQHSNTLADIAFYYWANDLHTNLANDILPSIKDPSGTDTDRFWNARNNPARWQHMVNFTIGLGLSGFLSEAGLTWNGNMYGGSYLNILNGTQQWPQASSGNNNPANVADLWHAAINSRGQFFSADDPASLSLAFQAALTAITDDSGASAALSANSTSLTGDTIVYQAKFQSSDWSGTLLALAVNQADGQVATTPAWDAATLIPAHDSRRIFTYNGTSGVEFSSCANLSTEQQGFLNRNAQGAVDNHCDARLQWLRGNPKDEVRMTGGSSLRLFRNRPVVNGRPVVMGDIINSDPAYVGAVNFGYSGLPAGTPGQSSYEAFRTANMSRVPMVYVGSNDGRLYGIRGDAGHAQSGVEMFSYIPAGVYPNLSQLTEPSYSHRYFVDGSIIVRDAYVGGSWKTILIAGLNSGGRSIYALDVTDGANFDASKVMWEFNESQGGEELGYTFSRPQIGILENGKWVAIFGNGYNSPTGGAHLYVVDLETGDLIRKIQASEVAGTDESNGLSTPLLVDTDDNYLIDTVYAGDLHGNMWKFDLSNSSPAVWHVSNNRPLFRAPTGQAITAQPKVTGHPSGGLIVLFGTGRYLANSDVTSQEQQAFYGIRDDGTWTSTATVTNLQQQSFRYQGDISGRAVRSVSRNTVDWGTQRGWYLNLLRDSGEPSERVVNTSLVVRNMVIFSSIIPSDDECDPGGTSWLNVLDVNTGGEFNHTLFDLDGDGEFDSLYQDDGETYYMNAVRTDRLGISNVPVLIYEDLTPNDPNDDPSLTANIMYAIGTGTTGQTETNPICLNPSGCGPTPPAPVAVKRRSWIQIR